MKRYFIIVLTLFFSFSTKANNKYQIDLRKKPAITLTSLQLGHKGPAGKEIEVNNLYMSIGGKPVVPVMGEFHYNRMDPRYWRETLLKMKASGVNIVSSYILWILHEEFEGRQSWSGHNDLRHFVELCQELGLMVHLRIGPYCNAEIRNGGFPDWVERNKQFRVRTNDPLYLEYVKYWYESIFNQIGDLLYKDNGPIMAIQLENEFVTEGLVRPHLMTLKKIAVEIGYDVPIYSMTHWISVDYPKGEIIPYAGYYIETPWILDGPGVTPISRFQFLSYNRVADNIGNDFIKVDRGVESLEGESSDSPYFTCEIGLGTPNYYMRRAVVPKEMAGSNINLRLACGVNLMGYYLYAGQTNPIGEQYILSRATARISNDYQAPIKEFGTLGVVMKEAKKFNYFMNDFGESLAPAKAYLPVSNKDTANLQWSVRFEDEGGFLFCSNYLYKHNRKDFENVQFNIRLDKETLSIPRNKTTIKDETYFAWPFNQQMGNVHLKYATVQPICKHTDSDTESYFFFENNGIPGEFLLNAKGIKDISVRNGQNKIEKNAYFIHSLVPGKECKIEITKNDGKKVLFVILTQEESEYIWKGDVKGKDFVILTESSLIYDKDLISVISEDNTQDVWEYQAGKFIDKKKLSAEKVLNAGLTSISPMSESDWIKPSAGNIVRKEFNGKSLSEVERAYIRFYSTANVSCILNDTPVETTAYKDYTYADVTTLYKNGGNKLSFSLEKPSEGVIAEMEVLLTDGTRWVWCTNDLWSCDDNKTPVTSLPNKYVSGQYAPEEHLALYKIKVPDLPAEPGETRLHIDFRGDIANAYIGQRLIHDVFFNGTSWIIGLNRYDHLFDKDRELIVRINGFKSDTTPIFFEKNVNIKECVNPAIKKVKIKPEYRKLLQ